MKYIYILENEKKFRDEMIEAIQKIDPQIAVRWFDSLSEFANWIKILMIEGPPSLAKGGHGPPNAIETGAPEDQLVLVISKDEFLGSHHMTLLRKTRDLFIKKGVCTSADPTSLVITSFESPEFDIKLVEDRIINNVVFKPFDKLILQQHLTFAIGGRHPASQYSVHNMKTSAKIEMLKEVEIEAMSDVGFISVSNRQIPTDSLAKYYSPAFISAKHRSMMARCVRCEPHPEIKDQFRCAFAFLAADAFQISNIRKEVRKKDVTPFKYEWIPQHSDESAELSLTVTQHHDPVEVALIVGDEELRHNFKDLLEKHFKNVHVHLFPHLQTFLYSIDPEQAKKDKKNIDPAALVKVPATFHAIFADNSYFEESFKERWQNILETLQKKMRTPAKNPSGKTEVFTLSNKAYSDDEERALGEVVKDIFYTPIDPMYLVKKLCLFLPQLVSTEELQIATVALKHIAKVASPIEISEFSEAGLVMKYYRPISVGAFREFVLWLPHELDLPEFLAACNYSEENKADKSSHFNHFVFFGTNDRYLLHIRRWILENHIHSKESESA